MSEVVAIGSADRRGAAWERRRRILCLIASRLASALPSLAGVIIATFLLTRALPGDPAAYFAGPTATADSIAEMRTRLGLDHSLFVQFLHYIAALGHGDLGVSLTSGQPVLDDLAQRLPASMELTLGALLLAILIGLPLGMAGALRPGGVLDRLCLAISVAGQAVPTFFLGLLLIYVFYYLLGLAPAQLGRLDVSLSPPTEITGFWLIDALLSGDVALVRAVLSQLVLPVITLAMFAIAPIARMTRASMLAVLSSDFIRTANAFGLPAKKVLWTCTFRNALLPILNTIGMVFSFLLGANVLVEKVFGWPGIGAYAIEAVIAADYAPIQGFVLAMAILYLVINLAIDVAGLLLDPRIRGNE